MTDRKAARQPFAWPFSLRFRTLSRLPQGTHPVSRDYPYWGVSRQWLDFRLAPLCSSLVGGMRGFRGRIASGPRHKSDRSYEFLTDEIYKFNLFQFSLLKITSFSFLRVIETSSLRKIVIEIIIHIQNNTCLIFPVIYLNDNLVTQILIENYLGD